MGSSVKKVFKKATTLPRKIIKTVKKNPELLALAAFIPGLQPLAANAFSGITAAGSSAFLKGAAKRALLQALATKATGGDVSIKDSLIGGAVGQGIGQFAGNAAMFKNVDPRLLQAGIGATTNVGTSLATGQKIDPRSALISGGLNYLTTPQGLSTDDAIGYDEQLRIEQGAPTAYAGAGDDLYDVNTEAFQLPSTQAANITPQPKPEFLGQELRQTPTPFSVADSDGMVMGLDEFSPLTPREELARMDFGSTGGDAIASTQDLTDAINRPEYDTYLPEDIGGAADMGFPTGGTTIPTGGVDNDAAKYNVGGKEYGSAEMPSTTANQLPDSVNVTDGKVDFFQTGSYKEIANDLMQGNLADAAKLTYRIAKDNPFETITALSAAAPLFFSPVPQEGESEEDFTQRKVDVTNYLRQYGSNFYSGADLDDFISRATSNFGYSQGGRVGLEMGGDAIDSYDEISREEIELMRRINEFNMQRAMLEDLEDARENAREDKMGGGIMGLEKMPMGTPRMNQGGVTELDYRAEGGFVPVGIKEKADDVPAMLSKNEFVMTADAVRSAGDGSIEKGAQKMYDTMKQLESRVV